MRLTTLGRWPASPVPRSPQACPGSAFACTARTGRCRPRSTTCLRGFAGMMLALIAGGCVSTNRNFSVQSETEKNSEQVKAVFSEPGSSRMPAAPGLFIDTSKNALDTTDDDDTISEDPGDLIADARLFCRDSNYTAADSLPLRGEEYSGHRCAGPERPVSHFTLHRRYYRPLR